MTIDFDEWFKNMEVKKGKGVTHIEMAERLYDLIISKEEKSAK